MFIGSTAEKVLDRLSCDVLVIKPEDFAAHLGKPVQLLTPDTRIH